MKEKMLKIALKMFMSCIKGADGHEVARTISKQLTLSELGALSGTFKEAEIRRKESDTRIRGGAYD